MERRKVRRENETNREREREKRWKKKKERGKKRKKEKEIERRTLKSHTKQSINTISTRNWTSEKTQSIAKKHTNDSNDRYKSHTKKKTRNRTAIIVVMWRFLFVTFKFQLRNSDLRRLMRSSRCHICVHFWTPHQMHTQIFVFFGFVFILS